MYEVWTLTGSWLTPSGEPERGRLISRHWKARCAIEAPSECGTKTGIFKDGKHITLVSFSGFGDALSVYQIKRSEHQPDLLLEIPLERYPYSHEENGQRIFSRSRSWCKK